MSARDRTPRPMGLTVVDRTRESRLDTRPLSLSLFTRLFRYTRGCASTRNWLFLCVTLRAVQGVTLPWMMASIISGPIRRGDWPGLVLWLTALVGMTVFTQATHHFRQRLGLELGETVVRDLRRDLFQHMLELPMGYFHRTRPGLLINRFTTDAEAVRTGVQKDDAPMRGRHTFNDMLSVDTPQGLHLPLRDSDLAG